jgi:hypothetical protein
VPRREKANLDALPPAGKAPTVRQSISQLKVLFTLAHPHGYNNFVLRTVKNWCENRRIVQLFSTYSAHVRAGASDAEARFAVLLELKMRAARLGDQLTHLDAGTQSQEIDALFSPLRVLTYDLFALVAFIVKWENPRRYNETLSLEKLRTGDNEAARLDKRIAAVAARLFAEGTDA